MGNASPAFEEEEFLNIHRKRKGMAKKKAIIEVG